MNYYISNPYLHTHQIQNTQITPINTSHILLKYSPCHWAPTNILYTQAHKLPWALSQIFPIIAHILSNLGFHKNTHHTTTKNRPQNYIISTKSPKSFYLWAKSKESPNSLKSHYDVANSMPHYDVANPKAHFDVANPKPATMRQYLQSPL